MHESLPLTDWAYAHPEGLALDGDGVLLTRESVEPKLRAWLGAQGCDVPAAMDRLEQWLAREPAPALPDDGFDPFADD